MIGCYPEVAVVITVRTISDLADIVRGRRLELALSQDEVARRAGISRKWIYEFEAGQPAAELRKVLAVLAVLHLTLGVHAGITATSPGDAIDLDALLTDYDTD